MRKSRIESILTKELHPTYLDLSDQSHLHTHHNPYAKKGESHFTVVIVSDAFDGLSLVKRHRMVNQLLDSEFSSGLHALKLRTYTSGEWALK